ncbi:MAG: hypothetical protein HY823_02815 [Acidobacteria bacterium]|nr:hypothetical protein [Acidobacteriota bacterium]
MRILYLISLLGGFGLLGANGLLGHEFFGTHRKSQLPPDVRQTRGAYRTYLHNYGFRGGK